MKKYIAALFCVLLTFTACSNGSNGNTEQQPAETEQVQTEKAASFNDIFASIKDKTTLPLTTLKESFITSKYNIPTDELEEVIFAQAEDSATNAESIYLLRAKDATKLPDYKAKLEAYIAQKATEFNNHGLPEQAKLLSDCTVNEKNGCLYCVVSENSEEILEIIEKAL